MKSISQKPLKFGTLKAGKGVISLKLEKVSETFLLSFTKTMKAKFRIITQSINNRLRRIHNYQSAKND